MSRCLARPPPRSAFLLWLAATLAAVAVGGKMLVMPT